MNALPEFSHSFPRVEDDVVSRCDVTLQIIQSAQSAGVVDAPAISICDFSSGNNTNTKLSQLNPLRFHVITKQLWLLGYLSEEPRRNISPTYQESPEFRNDLCRFQRDSGLHPDGWLGEKTWKTLQELVSFETPINPSDWKTSSGDFRTAFNRALQLRMWAYGFIEKKPAYIFAGLRENKLDNVRRIIGLFYGIENDWLSILFDSEKIIEGAIKSIKNYGVIDEGDKTSIRRFLISTARVELWLLGIEIKIDNTDDYEVEHFGVKRKRVRRGGKFIWKNATNRKLNKGLESFWGELVGYSATKTKSLSSKITVEFFEALKNPENFAKNTEEFNEPDFSKQAAEALNTTEGINSGYTRYRSLGMKLWDGMKRIWRWLVKGVKKIVKLADNLVRGFFRFATKSYIIVRTAFIALVKATEQYITGKVENTGKSIVLIDKDFDFKVVTHNGESSSSAVFAIQRFSSSFLFSSKIVGLIIDLFMNIAQGVIGWARFLYILVKSYREIAPIYSELQSVN